MASKRGAKIFPHLWYAKEAEEAARFYASPFRTRASTGWDAAALSTRRAAPPGR